MNKISKDWFIISFCNSCCTSTATYIPKMLDNFTKLVKLTAVTVLVVSLPFYVRFLIISHPLPSDIEIVHVTYNDIGLEVYKVLNNSHTRSCKHVTGRRILLTFGNHHKYLEMARNACKIHLHQKGIDSCYIANMQFLDDKFKEQNFEIFKIQRGAGRWIWKPHLIMKFLTEFAEEDDNVFYIDADYGLVHPIESVICIQHTLKQDIVIFSQYQVERMWTRGDVFILMNLEKEKIEQMANSVQIHAAFVLFRKTHRSLALLAEWMTYAQDSRLITNNDTGLNLKPNYFEFKNSRNDQTILSLLCKRWKIPLWPSPYFEWQRPRGQYGNGTLFYPYERIDAYRFYPQWPILQPINLLLK